MGNHIQLVNDQESFFNNALTSQKIVWEKESQFAIQALGNNEYLSNAANNSPASLQNAIINIAAIGISLNPVLKHCYLVPRSQGQGKPMAVCLDISYQGLLHLAMQSGSILWGQSKLVHQNDKYENTGINTPPNHKQCTFGEKGTIIGVYCTVKLPSGDFLTEEMDLAAIKKVQSTSKAANGPWKSWWEEMARKTVIKRASKYWPKSESLSEAVSVIDQTEGLETPEKEVKGSVVNDNINEDQYENLINALNVAGVTEKQFCSNKKIGISTLYDLQSARYEGAMSWIKSQAQGV